MAKPQYGPEHRAEREALRPVVEAGEAYCAEPICLVERDGGSRWIEPWSEWHLAHDRTRPGEYHGPAHARCNESEGGRHNRMRKPTAWAL